MTKRIGLHLGSVGISHIPRGKRWSKAKNMKRKNVADELMEAMREVVEIAAGRVAPAKVHHFSKPVAPPPLAPVKLSQ